MQVRHLDHVVITVRDVQKVVEFYKILGMRHEHFVSTEGDERHAMHFGPHKINIHVEGKEFQPHAHQPIPGAGDFCFLSDEPVDAWMAHLQAHHVDVFLGPVPRNGASGAIRSIYMRDPEGNLIEIANPDNGSAN